MSLKFSILLVFVLTGAARLTLAQELVIEAQEPSMVLEANLAADQVMSNSLSLQQRDEAKKIFGTAFELLQSSDNKAAELGFQRGLAIDPANLAANFYMAEALQALGKNSRAMSFYSRVIALDPNSAEGLKATVALDAFKDDRENLGNLYFQRGNEYQKNKNIDGAMFDFSQSIALAPKMAAAYNNRGLMHLKKGQIDQALDDFNQGIVLDPKLINLYQNRGIVYGKQGKFSNAVDDFTEGIALDPKVPALYYLRGNTYRLLGDDAKAIIDFDQSISMDPKSALNYIGRGHAYTAEGDYIRAIDDYTKAIGLSPNPAHIYYVRGLTNLYAGSLSKAVTDLTKSNSIDPKYPYALVWLSVAASRSGLSSGLDEKSKQIDMTLWPAPVVRLFLGQINSQAVLASIGDFAAESRKDHECEAHLYIGEKSLQRGEKDAAAQQFRLAVAGCKKTFVEYDAAVAELKMLGVAQ